MKKPQQDPMIGVRDNRFSEKKKQQLRSLDLFEGTTFAKGEDKIIVFKFPHLYIFITFLPSVYTHERRARYKINCAFVFSLDLTIGKMIGTFPLTTKTASNGHTKYLIKEVLEGVSILNNKIHFSIKNEGMTYPPIPKLLDIPLAEALKITMASALQITGYDFNMPKPFQL